MEKGGKFGLNFNKLEFWKCKRRRISWVVSAQILRSQSFQFMSSSSKRADVGENWRIPPSSLRSSKISILIPLAPSDRLRPESPLLEFKWVKNPPRTLLVPSPPDDIEFQPLNFNQIKSSLSLSLLAERVPVGDRVVEVGVELHYFCHFSFHPHRRPC